MVREFSWGLGPEGAWTLAKSETKSKKKPAAPAKAAKPKTAPKPAAKAPSKSAPAKKEAKPIEKPAGKSPTKPMAPAAKKPESVKAAAPAPKPGAAAAGAKPSGSGKEGITIKTPMKKVPPPPPKTIPAALLPKSKGGSNAGPPPAAPTGDKARFRNPFQTDFNDGKAAAAKLFAAAGLAGLKHTKAPTIEDEMAAKPLTKSPLNKTQLKEFRDMLIAKRAEAAGDVQSMEAEALGGGSGSLSNLPQHMADQGTDTFDQSMALSMAASKRTILRDIDAALQRIEDNTYGICEMLGKPIEIQRLQAEPWTRYSIEGARHKERMSMMR